MKLIEAKENHALLLFPGFQNFQQHPRAEVCEALGSTVRFLRAIGPPACARSDVGLLCASSVQRYVSRL
eukprot:2978642-Amphidinium_carterae.1